MAFLYNLGIKAYEIAIYLASPFHEKAALWVKGRKKIRKKIRTVTRGSERLVWFHAASLGEFEQGRPVMEALKKEQPATKILLTFFSPSGYEIRKNYQGADFIFYLPADTPANARFFLNHFKPDAAVFIKYEFWYNYLYELSKYQIPVYLISALFRQEQPFFKRWGGLHRKMLHFFTRIFVQDHESVSLLRTLGITEVQQTGDTRFDRVKQIATEARHLAKIEAFLGKDPAIVCGSTWPPDEEILLNYINTSASPYKWILAPHEIGENHIRSILGKCQRKAVRYTDEQADLPGAEVLIIDCIGLLSSVYRYGKIAYIGGGFGVGIHNTLEAAVYGLPVVFGPKYRKFQEAMSLTEKGGAFSIKNGEELKNILDVLIETPEIATTAGERARNYVNSQLGATQTIMQYLSH